MNSPIKKTNLGAALGKAASAAPGIAERIAHAKELVSSHPVAGSTPQPGHDSQGSPTELPSGGRLVAASVDLIDPNPFNARKIYRPERVAELASSIRANGQDVPGIATVRDGRYVLAAGHYRHRASKQAGLPTMNLMVYDDLTDKQLFAYSWRENAEREGQSALDNALCWFELIQKGLYRNETEIAEETGISLPNINKTMKLLDLSPEALEVVRENPTVFALSALYELVLFERVAPKQEAIEMVKKLREGEIGRAEINQARTRYEAPKARKRKETSRPYNIAGEGASGSLKVWDSGRVVLDVVVEDSEKRNAVLAEIKSRFGISE